MATPTDILAAAGGIGMFLLGMDTMTGALRSLAGGQLRQLLSRVTTSPLRGVVTGAGVTAVIQSSSATTVMTVGFVGAGLLTLHQAIGILLGANIGTTATGWMVSLLGFKLALGKVAMFTLLPSALAVVLGNGLIERAGRLIAGLSLLLIGLELMQQGVGDSSGLFMPEEVAQAGFRANLTMLMVGLVLTVVIQSSSAAVALALVLLSSGAITVLLAAMMVIGMNIGTTFTAILASLGGSRIMRQAAMANLAFNLVTAALAFPLLWVGHGVLETVTVSAGPLTALLLFHTGFNLLGTFLFLPFTHQLVNVVRRWVPDPEGAEIVRLDPAFLRDSATALLAAHTASEHLAQKLLLALSKGLSPTPDFRQISALGESMPLALDELGDYLARIRTTDDKESETYSALLHQTDHMRRLIQRARETGKMTLLLEDRVLRRPTQILAEYLRRAGENGLRELDPDRLKRLEKLMEVRARRHRRSVLLGEHAGLYSMRHVYQHTDAMRWLLRALHHVQRLGKYGYQADQLRRERGRSKKQDDQ